MAVAHGGRPVAGRKFPTGATYAEALQHPSMCFRDPDLKRGTVQQSPVLGPKAISGNFASVFSVTAPGGQRYALKCFTRDSSTLGVRYAAISEQLGRLGVVSLSQSWPVSFEYLDQGVLVAGNWYPMLKMAWVHGTGLIGWIEQHARDTATLKRLTERFAAMAADLEQHGIAHGDLQHGNILVASDGTLRLVDYDGMYVPSLAGHAATENGHRNYQLPSRSSTDFGPATDRFSAWVIYLSLVAVATDPGIWNQLHDAQGEFLLLSESDFVEPRTSHAWQVLTSHRDQALGALAQQVRGYLGLPVTSIPPLSTQTITVPSPMAAHRATAAVGSAAPAAGVPTWMTGRIPAGIAAAAPAAGATSTVGTGYTQRRATDVLLSAVALLTTSAPATVAVWGAMPDGVLPAAQAIALLVSATAVGSGRMLRPERRAARAHLRGLRRQLRNARHPASALRKVERELRSLDESLAQEDAKAAQHSQKLQATLHNKQSKITIALNRQTAALQKSLNDLAGKESALIAAALAPAIASHVRTKLGRTSIHEAKQLTGFGPKMVQALINHGIRTAADFTGVVYAQGQYNSRSAYLVLASGLQVSVPGIGEARATTLEGWRQSLENRAKRSAPTVVPAQERQRIGNQIAAERSRLQADLKQAEAKARQSRAQVQASISAQQQDLATQQKQRRAQAQQRRAALLQRQSQLAGADIARKRLEAELACARSETRQALGMRSYLRLVITGR